MSDTVYRVVADPDSEHGFATRDAAEAEAWAEAGYEVYATVEAGHE